MKLKFRPGFGKMPPPPSGDENNSSHQDTEASQNKSIGKGMIAASFIVALIVLTALFQGAIEKQNNPNQRPQSKLNEHGQTEIELKRNRRGHYVFNGQINDKTATFLLDTGATNVAIPLNLAQKLNLRQGRKVNISTANGSTIGYHTRIDELKLGEIVLYDIPAILTPNLHEILFGMSALKQLEFSQSGNRLTIRQ